MGEVETAYHEAGHAVVAYHRGLPMEGADIVATGDRAGVLKMGEPPAYWDAGAYGELMKAWYFGAVMVRFAGTQAVELLTGKAVGEHDPNVMQLPGSDWSGVAAMFGELEQDGLQRAYDEAERVLRDNRHAVKAVAEALLEHEALDKGELYAVLDGAGCARDAEAVALVEEAYRDGHYLVLSEERFRLFRALQEARDRGASEGEVMRLEQELLRVDGEIVEAGGLSMIRRSDPEEDGEVRA